MFLTFSRSDLLIFIDGCVEKLKTKYKLWGNDLNDSKNFIKQKISKIIKYFRKHSYFYKTSKILIKENFKTFKWTWTHNHLVSASLAKWLSVRLWTKWLWVRVQLQGFPWHSGNCRVWIHSETRTWHGKNIQLKFSLTVFQNNFLLYP